MWEFGAEGSVSFDEMIDRIVDHHQAINDHDEVPHDDDSPDTKMPDYKVPDSPMAFKASQAP